MPINNSIAKLFELEDIMLKDIGSTNEEVRVFFSLKRKVHACPFCNTLTDKVHDYRTSIIKDLPFMGKKCFLHYHKRLYHCPCCNKHFYEFLAASKALSYHNQACFLLHSPSRKQTKCALCRVAFRHLRFFYF